MKRWHYILLGGLVCLIGGIQFIRSGKNISTKSKNNPIAIIFPVPEDVHQILITSCYDCHSNTTRYPWYTNIQPISWWLATHVDDGKHKLNFDEFASLSPRSQYKIFKEIENQITKNEMPLSSYTLMHRIAILSPEERDKIRQWCETLRDSMKIHFSIDSLE